MNTQQIRDILETDVFVRRIPIVKVLACDQLPTHLIHNKPAAFIINTDPISLPGQHWVSLFRNSIGEFTYFDSFGIRPLNSEILRFIENNSNRPFLYNSRVLQDIRSDTCGLYAIYFIMIKARGGSLQRFLLPFQTTGRKQYINDRIIKRLTHRWMYTHNPPHPRLTNSWLDTHRHLRHS